MKHKKTLESYPQGFETLATELGDLQYDALSQFLGHLSKKLAIDSIADGKRNRTKLSHELLEASKKIMEASTHIENAWDICEPYMKEQ